MEKIKKYIKSTYVNASAKWIFGVVAALGVLPDLIKTTLLCVTKESLGTKTIFFGSVLRCLCRCVCIIGCSFTYRTDKAGCFGMD